MNVADFDYELPESHIAQTPIEPRDAARLLTLDRGTGQIEHRRFPEIVSLINPGDVVVLNTTRVIRARLMGRKAESGGAVELLLLRQLDAVRWHVLAGGKRVVRGVRVEFPGSDIGATVVEALDHAGRVVEFDRPVDDLLARHGQMPLPPYIHTPLADAERYQTVFSRQEGSAAAPTAGLHFTPETLLALREKGVRLAYCVLHIGLDTFQPVQAERVENHRIHSERALLTPENARIINDARLAGGRVIAVGTTVARALETAAILSAGGTPSKPFDLPDMCPWRPVIVFERDTDLFIYPGYPWRVVDALLTNFHLPRSTLLMMVSAFAGRERVLAAYKIARREGYRFYSFGDAMFIT